MIYAIQGDNRGRAKSLREASSNPNDVFAPACYRIVHTVLSPMFHDAPIHSNTPDKLPFVAPQVTTPNVSDDGHASILHDTPYTTAAEAGRYIFHNPNILIFASADSVPRKQSSQA